jgi:Uma2 family endonuclease
MNDAKDYNSLFFKLCLAIHFLIFSADCLTMLTYKEFSVRTMQAQTKSSFISPEEYLALERKAEYKSEYFGGEIFAMAGGSKRHNAIAANIIGELRSQLKKRPCLVYPSDMRVKVSKTGLYTYPDVIVVCEEELFEDEEEDTVLNPVLIVEVLSDSTEAYDRGKKFEHYRQIDSLLEYLLVAQDHHRVEQFTKQKDGRWIFAEASSLEDTIKLASIGCELALEEIYDKIKLKAI